MVRNRRNKLSYKRLKKKCLVLRRLLVKPADAKAAVLLDLACLRWPLEGFSLLLKINIFSLHRSFALESYDCTLELARFHLKIPPFFKHFCRSVSQIET